MSEDQDSVGLTLVLYPVTVASQADAIVTTSSVDTVSVDPAVVEAAGAALVYVLAASVGDEVVIPGNTGAGEGAHRVLAEGEGAAVGGDKVLDPGAGIITLVIILAVGTLCMLLTVIT